MLIIIHIVAEQALRILSTNSQLPSLPYKVFPKSASADLFQEGSLIRPSRPCLSCCPMALFLSRCILIGGAPCSCACAYSCVHLPWMHGSVQLAKPGCTDLSLCLAHCCQTSGCVDFASLISPFSAAPIPPTPTVTLPACPHKDLPAPSSPSPKQPPESAHKMPAALTVNREILKGEMHSVGKHMERCSPSLVIKDLQIRTRRDVLPIK